MPSDLVGYRQKITNVPSIEDVSYSKSNADLLNNIAKTFNRIDLTIDEAQKEVQSKAQNRFFMEKKLQSTRAVNELSNMFQSDPNGLREASIKYRDQLLKDVDDTDLMARIAFDFDMDIESQIQKSTYGDAFASKFLNIKSIEEYKMCFVNWIIKRCPTRKDIYDELKFLKDFQLLYFKGKVKDDLFGIENEIKLDIMKKISENIYDPEAKGWFDEAVNIMRI